MESGSIFLVTRALFCVVFVVQKTGDVGQGAFLGRNPQVGASRVKNDFETLSWCSDRNNSEVLRVCRRIQSCEYFDFTHLV